MITPSGRRYDEDRRPEALAFLEDLKAVCRKHRLCLGHEDMHGGFEVRRFNEATIGWLDAAADTTEETFEKKLNHSLEGLLGHDRDDSGPSAGL